MSAQTVTEAFLAAAARVLAALRRDFAANTSSEAFLSLLQAVRSAGAPAEGSIGDDIRYAVHGAGSRFTLGDGRVVDLDVDPRVDAVVWNAWRVRQFAGDTNETLSTEQLEKALREQVKRGAVREVRPGWFSITSDRRG